MAVSIRAFFRIPAVLIIVLLALGVLLHEMGHVLAGILCGGSVTDIILFSSRPSVRISGQFTQAQEIFKAISGSGSVLLGWLFARRTAVRSGVVLDAASCLAGAELLGWTTSALSYPACPASNDAARLIVAAQIKPELLAAICLLMTLCGVLLHSISTAAAPRESSS